MQHKKLAMRHHKCFAIQHKERAHPAMGIREDLQHDLRSQDGGSGKKNMETGNGKHRHIIQARLDDKFM